MQRWLHKEAVLVLIISLIMTWNTPNTTAQDDWTVLEPINSSNLNRLSKLRTVNTDSGGIWLIESYSDDSQLYAAILKGRGQLLKLSANASGADIQFLAEYRIVMGIAVSPVSNELAVSTGYNTVIWNLASERQTRTIDPAHDYESVTFHPTNGTVVTGLFGEIAEWDRTVNVETQVLEVPGAGHITDIEFAPSGLQGAIGLTSGVILMDWQNNQPVYSVISNRTNGKVRFNATGSMLGFMSEGGYEIGLWDMAAEQSIIIYENGYDQYGNDIGFSADGSVFAIAGPDGVEFYDGLTGQYLSSLTQFTDEVTALSFSNDGRFLITGQADGQVDIWAVPPGPPTAPFAVAGLAQTLIDSDGDGIENVTLDGTASSDADGIINSYEWSENVAALVEPQTFVVVAEDPIAQVSLGVGVHTITLTVTDNDGLTDSDTVVVTVQSLSPANTSTPTITNAPTPTPADSRTPLDTPPNTITSIDWSPDGLLLATANNNGAIQIRDAASGIIVHDLITAQPNPVLTVAWSPDGTAIAATVNENVYIWQRDTWQVIHILQGHVTPVWSVAWSPDGTKLAGVNRSRNPSPNFLVWDTSTGQQIQAMDYPGTFYKVAWSPDNTSLATTGGNRVHLWDISQTTIQNFLQSYGEVVDAKWSPDGSNLAVVGGSGAVSIWDVASQQVIQEIEGHIVGTAGMVFAVEWSPDGSMVASAATDGTVRVWDAATGQAVHVINVGSEVYSVTWSPDGNSIAYGGRDKLFEVKSLPVADAGEDQTITDTDGNGTEDVTLDGTASSDPDGIIASHEWRENGEVIATGAKPEVTLEPGEHTITLVVTDNDGLVGMDEVVITIPSDEIVPPQANAGGNMVVVASEEKATITLSGRASTDPNGEIVSYEWRTGDGVIGSGVNPEVTLEPGIHVITLAVTDNDGLVGMDQAVIEVKAFEAGSGPVPPSIALAEPILYEHVAWHGDVIAATTSEDIWLYDSDTLRQTGFVPVSVGLMDMAWHPTEHRLAISGGDGFSIELSVWNMTTEQYDWKIPLSESCGYSLLPIRWSADGQLLALGLCGELHIYDGNTGTLIQSIADFGVAEVASIAWSPMGDTLITSSVDAFKLWNTATWTLITALDVDSIFWYVEWIGERSQVAVIHDYDIEIRETNTAQLVTMLATSHENVIHSLVWNDTGGLLSASYDGIIHVWDVETGEATTTLSIAGLRSVDWSPDGTQIVIGGANGLLEVQALPD